jgi:hypothetical protein
VQVGILVLLTVAISTLLFMIQRSTAKRRLFVAILSLVAAELIRRYVFYRDVHTEAWIALFVALFLNFGFYLFIGRYNPVKSSDEIKVYGLDD